MLALLRKENQSIIIELEHDVDPNMTVDELISSVPIEIVVSDIQKRTVELRIDVPQELNIVRDELVL